MENTVGYDDIALAVSKQIYCTSPSLWPPYEKAVLREMISENEEIKKTADYLAFFLDAH